MDIKSLKETSKETNFKLLKNLGTTEFDEARFCQGLFPDCSTLFRVKPH
jgi:hypothetical protein